MQETTESVGHIVPAKLYVTIWAILMAMTITTVLVARADIGPFNVVVALAIATIKATLVVLFFMHLRYSPKLTMATVVAAMFFLFLLLGLTMTDYLTRAWLTNPGY
ncbi:MAG TPA: cytochrome C oxidase subunit IV family protein [Candidatus Limnocylindrales bacterium]|nr:cytochrome C oxidase subunit IV family protein [Candidatus Limnocylindrales bacterium]